MSWLGSYQLGQEIGRGASGVVHRAVGPDGKEVAIKILVAQDATSRERFQRERRLLATLGEAEGFVPLVDSGDSPRGPYLVMPFLRGGSLAARLQQGPLPLDEVIELGTALAGALARAHERGIVHRDLKPGNILFAANGRPLVADLGLAKHFRWDVDGASQSGLISQSDAFRGTWGFMPPEQLRAAGTVGPPADVFAIGAILYECLAGRPAFGGTSVFEVVGAVEEGRHVPVERVRSDTPDWLARAIGRSLQPEPSKRFADARELLAALEAGASAPVTRRRGGVAAGVLLAVLVLSAVAWGLRRETTPLAPPPAPFVPKTTPPPPSKSNPEVPAPPELDALLETLSARGERGDRAVVAELDTLIVRHPGSARARAERGHLAHLAGDHERAIAECTRAIELDAKCWRAWFTRGASLVTSGRPDKAILDFDRAIALAPSDGRGWGNRGVAKVQANDVRGGIADLERAVTLAPGDRQGWANLALARARAEDLEGAIAAMSKAIELDRRNADCWSDRGKWRLKTGALPEALADTIRACELEPKVVHHWRQRADICEALGDAAGELAAYERAAEVAPTNVHVWTNLGNIRGRLGDAEGAIDAAQRAVDLDPRAANALRVIGIARAQRGEHRAAVDAFDRSIKIDPSAKAAWFYRGLARQKLGDDGAASDFERYLELDPNGPQAPYARKQLAKLRGEKP